MNKGATCIILTCMIAFPFAGLSGFSTKAASAIIRVPQDFSTIQEAIDGSLSEGTILVAPGTYHENITVSKPLTIRGENTDSTTIDQAGAFAVCHITADSVVITGFTIRGGSIGLWIDGGDYNTITSNAIINNDDGIWATTSNSTVISNNIIFSNVFIGLCLKTSNNTTVESNIITNCTHGIYSENSLNSSISENTIAQNYGDGIRLISSERNVVLHNMISNNSLGIDLQESDTNSIYENNLVSNFDQAHTENSTTNSWDNGSKGNYWNDYNGTDQDHDGIGDTPYSIDLNNADRFPLMSPWTKPALATDLNRDGKVNIVDITLVAQAFGSSPENARWDPICDLDHNNVVNIVDMAMVAKDFGKTS